MRRWAARNSRPDEVLRQGLEVEGEVVEPGRIVDLAAEEEVGVVALGDIGVLVDEGVIEDPQREDGQRQDADRSAAVSTVTLRTAGSLPGERVARVA